MTPFFFFFFFNQAPLGSICRPASSFVHSSGDPAEDPIRSPGPRGGWSPGYTASRGGLWTPCCCLSGKGYDTSAAGLRLSWSLGVRETFRGSPSTRGSGDPQFPSSRLSPQSAEEAEARRSLGGRRRQKEDGKKRKGLFRTLGDNSTSGHFYLYNLATCLG